ncbi:MAG: protein-methionine-sulfoxide reductase catalytic subunit MsrP [Pseudomonadales bacterium]|nr:protein-methionine-sulfoxide reductase catalytic subunit MsrP [Pseudomonadales bacterium]
MPKKPSALIKPSEITPPAVYFNRRRFIRAASAGVAGLLVPTAAAQLNANATVSAQPQLAAQPLRPNQPLHYRAVDKTRAQFYTAEALTPYTAVTSHNNFYEFGTDKKDPKRYGGELQTQPWSVAIEGEAEHRGVFTLEDILKRHSLEERVYRLRCVEAWSMVIPWVGFALADLIKWAQPTSRARYVQFETLYRPKQMRGQRSRSAIIDWPYVEGLTIAEATHPLAFMATGLYGATLPVQNGAPLRLVVPWKYGFKSIKSIVKIRFVEKQPRTSWNELAPREYGFYANVNPAVDHPRWSQATERRLPSSLFNPRRIPTLPFNGYAEQVAHLYRGLNLKRYF